MKYFTEYSLYTQVGVEYELELEIGLNSGDISHLFEVYGVIVGRVRYCTGKSVDITKDNLNTDN